MMLLYCVLLLSSLKAYAVVTPPQIIKGPQHKDVELNSDVEFTCIAEGYPQPNIMWTHSNKVLSTDKNIVVKGKGGKSRITIFGVTSMNEGEYCCIATNSHLITDSYCGAIHIIKAPIITLHPVDALVSFGGTTTLRCAASGAPKPTITWIHDENTISCRDKHKCKHKYITAEGYLVISRFAKRDGGSYTCFAKNKAGAAFSLPAYVKLTTARNSTKKFLLIIKNDTATTSYSTIPITTTVTINSTRNSDWNTIDSDYHKLSDQVFGLSPSNTLIMSFSIVIFLIIVGSVVITKFRQHLQCFNCEKRPDKPLIVVEANDPLKALEIPLSNLQFVKELGQGVFGVVYEARAKNLFEEGESVTVAVKTLRNNDSLRNDFEREAKLMSEFKHPNIVQLLALCYQEDKITCLLFEHMDGGDLCEFLRCLGPNADMFQQQRSELFSKNPMLSHQLTEDRLLSIASQICLGMQYLSEKNFIHRDLATRNCLVSLFDMHVKIADFGLTRQTYDSDYYTTGNSESVPIRWMSPEAILYAKYSNQSDVWAFGVTLWEIYSYAMQPYYGMTNEEVILCVCQGGVLSSPENTPEWMYGVMRLCWTFEPHERPSFKQLITALNKLTVSVQVNKTV